MKIIRKLPKRVVKNEKALSEREVKSKREVESKREVHHCLSTFLLLEVLLTIIRTGRQKQNRQELPEWEGTSRLACSGA